MLAATTAALLVGISPFAGARAQSRDTGERVILITLDGSRTQEVFSGLDPEILNVLPRAGMPLEEHALYKQFWASTAAERRQKLMPFFWGTLMTQHGSIAGNRAQGSIVTARNAHRISFSGYAEMLVGQPHDDLINSNDLPRNPFPTVFEVIRQEYKLPARQVATFASWGPFNAISEHREGATLVNAGPEPYGSDAEAAMLAMLQRDAAPPWPNIRYDAITMAYAQRHLERERPRLLHIAFDETDSWAHDGRYDRVLEAHARIDRYIEQLWTWLQSQADYRGRTHILIATDHGRGRTVSDWRHHSAGINGADEAWFAFVSPSMPLRGEWRHHAPLTLGQIAATIAKWMGVDWLRLNPAAGAAIP